MSVASMHPAAPTRWASQRTTEAPPAPTSQHRQPGAIPRASMWWNVDGSKISASASRRAPAAGAVLSSR